MLSGVGIICFAASYTVAFLSGFSRFFHANAFCNRLLGVAGGLISFGFLLAGFLAHTLFLLCKRAVFSQRFVESEQVFFFLIAWGIVAVCLHLMSRRPGIPFELYLLPLALLLIGIGTYGASPVPFPSHAAAPLLRMLHVVAFLLCVLLLAIGSVAAMMYFEQADCLKRKRKPFFGLRLPSLEWSRSLAVSTFFWSLCSLFLGVVCGSILTVEIRPSDGARFPYGDPLVLWALAMLLLWGLSTIRRFALDRPSKSEVAAPLFAFGLLLLLLLVSPFFKTAHWNNEPVLPSHGEHSRAAASTDDRLLFRSLPPAVENRRREGIR